MASQTSGYMIAIVFIIYIVFWFAITMQLGNIEFLQSNRKREVTRQARLGYEGQYAGSGSSFGSAFGMGGLFGAGGYYASDTWRSRQWARRAMRHDRTDERLAKTSNAANNLARLAAWGAGTAATGGTATALKGLATVAGATSTLSNTRLSNRRGPGSRLRRPGR